MHDVLIKVTMKPDEFRASAKSVDISPLSPGPEHTLSAHASRNPNRDGEQNVVALDDAHDVAIRALDLRIQHLETRVSASEEAVEHFQREVLQRLEKVLYQERSLELENSTLRQQIKVLTQELEQADDDIKTLDDAVKRKQEKRAAAFDQVTECLESVRKVRADVREF
ncbi:hypothetical protein V5O48_003333 [Marasmius crinis-equi]|uniref:Uncharacterized protein n=1 Tax=Marasmius crinis-equi TaxID=585013 RepID=A0ABR3FT73_9AGAR